MLQPGELRPAGFWIRFVAYLIDAFILDLASSGLLWLSLGVYGVGQEELTGSTRQVLGVLSWCVVTLPYFTIGHFRWGRTLGKKALGIRVIDAGGRGHLGLGQSMGRALALGLSYAVGMLGFVIAGFDPLKRSLHDRLAGTRVIRH